MEEKTDKTTTLLELQNILTKFRSERGWTKFNDPYDFIVALSAEAGELLQLILWKKDTDFPSFLKDEPILKERIAEEVADVLAYTLAIGTALNIDLTESFLLKLEKNAKKYPIIENTVTPPRKRWLE